MDKLLFGTAIALSLGLTACDRNFQVDTVSDVCEVAQAAVDTAQEAIVAYQAAEDAPAVPKTLSDNLALAQRLAAGCPAVAAVVDNAMAGVE